jgi:hypothetical protein
MLPAAPKKWPIVGVPIDDGDVLGNRTPIADRISIGCDLQ